jgi:FkbM family methyltransferase
VLGWLREKVSKQNTINKVDYFQQLWQADFPSEATKEDIYFCFRLVLDRRPSIEEWAGHSSRAGEPLADVVRAFVNSEEFKARRLFDVQLPPGIVTKHNGRFYVCADENDPMLGVPALRGDYEIHVSRLIDSILRPGDGFLDIGANLGYFSLLAAKAVGGSGHVYAIEPNEHNVKLLEAGKRANGFENITTMQVAASDRAETLFLHATVGNGSTSALDTANPFSARTVPGLPIDDLLASRKTPVSLIKIDIEGYEFIALKGAARVLTEDDPEIIFEFQGSGHKGVGGPDFLEWFVGKGYYLTNISRLNDVDRSQTVEDIMADFYEAKVDHLDILASRYWPHKRAVA